MKLYKPTLDILANLAKINNGLVFKAGNVLKTKSSSGGMPIVEVEFANVSFPVDFALYDISKLISVLSMFDDPEIDFAADHLQITDQAGRVASLRYADPSTIVHHDYTTKFKVPEFDVTFNMTQVELKNLDRALSVLSAPEMAITGDGESIRVSTWNSAIASSDKFSIHVGETNRKFTIIINSNYVDLIGRDYTFNLSFKGLVQFYSSNEHDTIRYWMTISEKSKVE